MENAALVALSRQMVLRRQMDVIANNIANVNTIGFKADRMLFATALRDIGNGQKAAFVRDIAVAHDYSDGPMAATGNPLDFAIRGDGFFQVETPDGIRYTRGGHFELDADGVLITSQGYPVLGDDGIPILTFPGDIELTVKADGTVSSESGEIGRLAVVQFDNVHKLRKEAGGLFDTDETPNEAEDASVVQGSVENSNVKPIIEMTQMIWVLRSYQSAQKLGDDHNRLMRQAISVLAGTSRRT